MNLDTVTVIYHTPRIISDQSKRSVASPLNQGFALVLGSLIASCSFWSPRPRDQKEGGENPLKRDDPRDGKNRDTLTSQPRFFLALQVVLAILEIVCTVQQLVS